MERVTGRKKKQFEKHILKNGEITKEDAKTLYSIKSLVPYKKRLAKKGYVLKRDSKKGYLDNYTKYILISKPNEMSFNGLSEEHSKKLLKLLK